MSFDFGTILLLTGLAFLYAAVVPPAWRRWALLTLSVLAVLWLQPRLPVRYAGFLLPLFLLSLTIAIWYWFIREETGRLSLSDGAALGLTLGVTLLMGLTRYLSLPLTVYAVRPPGLALLLPGLLLLGLIIWAVGRLRNRWGQWGIPATVLLILFLFVVWKSASLVTGLSAIWRWLAAQDVSLAAPLDLAWLGFSYVAFRLIHTLRERQLGKLPPLDLADYLTYVVFFAALPAGPIDRAERFQPDLAALPELARWDPARFQAAFQRIAAGLAKKFVLADSLALGLALNPTNATQVSSTAGLWLLLYGYALRLYLDFSGYSDIAIGIGLLFGIRLPENFDWPYLQTNLAAFWQRWHITLSGWLRHYLFTPLSRILLRRQLRLSPILIVLVAQLATMIAIGLWHGVSWNFLIWGVWHGLGLFVHKQWSDRTRRWYRNLQTTIWPRRLWAGLTWFLTFHYVVLGWVWFLLPDVQLAWQTLARLFGLEVSA